MPIKSRIRNHPRSSQEGNSVQGHYDADKRPGRLQAGNRCIHSALQEVWLMNSISSWA